MPEHHTFDLDASFRALEQDIATVSAAPGAAAAVTRARRRRRTTIGGVTAVAVLAVGGVALAQGLGSGGSAEGPAVSPTAQPSGSAPLDGAHLSAATDGWTPAWTVGDREAQLKMAQTFGGACTASLKGGGSSALTTLGNSDGDVAFAQFSDFGQTSADQEAGWASLRSQLDACKRATSISEFSSDAGHSYTYRIDPESSSKTVPGYVWIADTGSAIAYLKIFDQSEPLPHLDDASVASALLAAAADPATYQGTTRVGRIDPTQTLGQVWAEGLQPALAGWSSPWDPHLSGGGSPPDQPACTQDFFADPSGNGETVNVGGNGHEWVEWLDTEADATQALQNVQHDLESCSTPYTFHTVTLADGRSVLVGVGPQVFWATRVGSHDLVISVPAGDAPPSDDVSRQVGGVLEHVLEQPATTTMAPGSPVPDWMKSEIAAAPTFGP